uniref:NAC domain-containing protein n=1 Tax=Anisakis simplex TaxID=6269 RepID=A0A0M3J3U8_ANISI
LEIVEDRCHEVARFDWTFEEVFIGQISSSIYVLMGDNNNEEDEGIIWESSQPSSSAATDETRRRSDDDPLSLSLPTQKIEQFLCTSPTRVIPAMTASDISRNVNSQNLFFDDVEIDPSQNQIILEDEEFLFNLPQEAATSSVQLADALYDRITTDDQFNDSKVYDTLTNISTPLRPYSAATSSSENITMKSSTEPSPVMSTNLNYSYDYAAGAVQGRNFNSAQSLKQLRNLLIS